jgi:phosphoglycolate phosphatase-like HAD superfamily hydrolase
MLGPASVVDFDGTLARLVIDWDELRAMLDIERIDQLWERQDSRSWQRVTEAEIAAAAIAEPVEVLVEALSRCRAFAVLTNNSEVAVRTFLNRVGLTPLATAIVGRETLGGPKSDFAVFSVGFKRCRNALFGSSGNQPIYVGDMQYELAFARQLGATALDVRDITASKRPR